MTAVRHIVWLVGAPARWFLISGVRIYRAALSGWFGGECRFYPSCSHYAEDAIRTHGAVKGSALATWRVLRCNPYGKGGVDHVPARSDTPSGGGMTPSHRSHPRESGKVTA